MATRVDHAGPSRTRKLGHVSVVVAGVAVAWGASFATDRMPPQAFRVETSVDATQARSRSAARVSSTGASRGRDPREESGRAQTSAIHLRSTAGVEVDVEPSGARLTLGRTTVTIGARSVGRAHEAVRPLNEGTVTMHADRAEVAHESGIVEWWQANARGVEHGLNLPERPSGSGLVEVVVEITGTLVARVGPAAVVLVDSRGQQVGRYDSLEVVDARGRPVPAWFADVEDHRVAIRIDDSHATYPLVVDPLAYAVVHEFDPVAGSSGGLFGQAVVMSADGNTLVIGAPSEVVGAVNGTGSVRVFVRSGNTWTLERKIDPPVGVTDCAFGASISLDGSGTRLAVGAPSQSEATGTATMRNGAVYTYLRNGGTWTFEAKLLASDRANDDAFGWSVALDAAGTRLVVGAPFEDTATAPATTDNGAIYAFQFGTGWSGSMKYTASDRASGDQLGTAVDLGVVGSQWFLVAGAPYADEAASPATTDSGATYVFCVAGGCIAPSVKLVASGVDRSTDAHAGTSVDVSGDGHRLAVGVPGFDNPSSGTTDSGAAFVYYADYADTWTREARLTVPTNANGDGFGQSVGFDAAGTSLVGGAPTADAPGFPGDGVVSIFRRPISGWTFHQSVYSDASLTGFFSRFGWSVSSSADGTRVLAGAPRGFAPPGNQYGIAFEYDELLTQGSRCTLDEECGSVQTGHCVDGVCCDSPCGGGAPDDCQACVGTFTGSADGVCASVGSAIVHVCRASRDACDAPEMCNPLSISCPADALEPTTTVCRAAIAGGCDVAETCTGTADACPADAVESAGTPCRAAAGLCDVAEACTGASPNCPPDQVAVANQTCRATLGACDPEEKCDGTSTACPGDVRLPAGAPCRTVDTRLCDVEERCDGTSVVCPPDTFRASGAPCRNAVGTCDVPEECTGTSAECPADGFRADRSPCDDGLACSVTSECQAGACQPAVTIDCTDGNACTTDTCVEPMGCTHTTIPACLVDLGVDDGGRDDAGATVDGGGVSPVASGCSCRAGGVRDDALPTILLAACSFLLRRVRVGGGRAHGRETRGAARREIQRSERFGTVRCGIEVGPTSQRRTEHRSGIGGPHVGGVVGARDDEGVEVGVHPRPNATDGRHAAS